MRKLIQHYTEQGVWSKHGYIGKNINLKEKIIIKERKALATTIHLFASGINLIIHYPSPDNKQQLYIFLKIMPKG